VEAPGRREDTTPYTLEIEMVNGVSVVTTTYNEKENLKILIPRLRNVLTGVPHEIIVVDDNSPDGTYFVAKQLADKAICKKREGQSKGLLTGMLSAKYDLIVTLDADLENPPELIPTLLENLSDYDILVACRSRLPRISEKFATFLLGRPMGISDFYSNFRVYRKHVLNIIKDLDLGESFGGEFLVRAWVNGCRIGEYRYSYSFRRGDPRLGGMLKSNLRIIYATIKLLFLYLSLKIRL